MADKITQFKGTIYENGYGLIAKKPMKDSELSIGAKGLYAYICSYAGNENKAFPSRELITHELSISKDTFNKYKNELLEKDYLAIIQVKSNGKFKRNEYELINSPCPKSSDTESSDTESSDTTNKDTTNNNFTNNNFTNNNLNIYMSDSTEYRLAQFLYNHILKNNPNAKESNLQKWAKTFELIIRIDKRTSEDIKKIIEFSQKDEFWKCNILSPGKLREKYDQLYLKMISVKKDSPPIQKKVQGEPTNKRQYDVNELERQLLGRD